MSDLEGRLTAALHADAPPARDAIFRVEVLVRLEQARFKRQVARTIVVAVVPGLLAALNAPLIDGWLAAAGQHVLDRRVRRRSNDVRGARPDDRTQHQNCRERCRPLAVSLRDAPGTGNLFAQMAPTRARNDTPARVKWLEKHAIVSATARTPRRRGRKRIATQHPARPKCHLLDGWGRGARERGCDYALRYSRTSSHIRIRASPRRAR